MKWSALNKDQKQKVMLVALLCLGLIYAVFRFGLSPMLDHFSATTMLRDDLRTKVEQGQGAIRGEAQLEAQLKNLRSSLELAFSDLIPPTDNALSWATQFINNQTRRLGLEDASISETEISLPPWMAADQAKRIFKPYTVRAEMMCTFEETKKLVRSLHESNPFLTVGGVVITADAKSHEKHMVTLTLDWPSWKDLKLGQHPLATNSVGVKDKDNGKRE